MSEFDLKTASMPSHAKFEEVLKGISAKGEMSVVQCTILSQIHWYDPDFVDLFNIRKIEYDRSDEDVLKFWMDMYPVTVRYNHGTDTYDVSVEFGDGKVSLYRKDDVHAMYLHRTLEGIHVGFIHHVKLEGKGRGELAGDEKPSGHVSDTINLGPKGSNPDPKTCKHSENGVLLIEDGKRTDTHIPVKCLNCNSTGLAIVKWDVK